MVGPLPLAESVGMPSEFMGYLIAAVVTILAGAVAIKNLLTKPADKEAVPRKEHDELKAQLANIVSQFAAFTAKTMEFVTRKEMEDFRAELNRQVVKLERYARARNQKLSEQVGDVKLGIEVLHRDLQKELGAFTRDINERVDRILAAKKDEPRP